VSGFYFDGYYQLPLRFTGIDAWIGASYVERPSIVTHRPRVSSPLCCHYRITMLPFHVSTKFVVRERLLGREGETTREGERDCYREREDKRETMDYRDL